MASDPLALAPIAPQLATTAPTTLILKAKKGAGGSSDYAVMEDTDCNLVFAVSNDDHVIRTHRRLKDAEGNVVGQLRNKKTPGIHTTFYLGSADDDKAAALRKSGLSDPTTCDADILVGGRVVGQVSVEGPVSSKTKAFKVKIGENLMANIARMSTLHPQSSSGRAHGYTMDQTSFGGDYYCIGVLSPGVDLAFVALIAIALDEFYSVGMFDPL